MRFKWNNFVASVKLNLWLPDDADDDDADSLKHVRVLTIYAILLLYMMCYFSSGSLVWLCDDDEDHDDNSKWTYT